MLTKVFAKELFPTKVKKSIFLAGPTPRDYVSSSWREEAVKILNQLNFDGHVFIPEPRDGFFKGDYIDQVNWETEALNRADIIVFWVPRNSDMPALTTNIEFGTWATSGKVVLGYPENAEHMRYLQVMADEIKIPSFKSLEDTLKKAIDIIGEGSLRTHGETYIPLLIWNNSTFKNWYKAQIDVGNKLVDAKVLWNFRAGANKDKVFCWVVHVKVWIELEQRIKSNEFVFGRTDLSSIALLYIPFEQVKELDQIEVLLVKEFRSPVRNSSGFVYELPGGSSKDSDEETLKVALHELEEETSFSFPESRLQAVTSRQVAATLSAHTNSLFVGQLTKKERDFLYGLKTSGKTFGVISDTEKTYVELMSLKEILDNNLLDWNNIGMIFSAIKKVI